MSEKITESSYGYDLVACELIRIARLMNQGHLNPPAMPGVDRIHIGAYRVGDRANLLGYWTVKTVAEPEVTGLLVVGATDDVSEHIANAQELLSDYKGVTPFVSERDEAGQALILLTNGAMALSMLGDGGHEELIWRSAQHFLDIGSATFPDAE